MKVDQLHVLMVKFQQELLSFRRDFLSFRNEMIDFKKETKDELNNLSRTLVGIENTLSFYGDMYKINRDGIRDLDRRVTVLEGM